MCFRVFFLGFYVALRSLNLLCNQGWSGDRRLYLQDFHVRGLWDILSLPHLGFFFSLFLYSFFSFFPARYWELNLGTGVCVNQGIRVEARGHLAGAGLLNTWATSPLSRRAGPTLVSRRYFHF